jgi:hypothetical protein
MDKLKTTILASLIASSLMVSVAPAMADWDRSPRDHYRWGRSDRRDVHFYREQLQQNYRDLRAHREHLAIDRRNGANSHQIARDQRAIQADLNNIENNKKNIQQFGWDEFGRR